MNKNDEEYTLDLHKLLMIFAHNLFLLISIAVACGVVGFITSKYVIKPTYSASATMYVNNSKIEQEAKTITQADLNASSNLVDTYSVILKSHTVLQQVIDEDNLDMSFGELEKKISISPVNKTQVMKITVNDTSPELAVNIVKKLTDLAPNAIRNSMDSGSVKVVDQPWTTGSPVFPNVLQVSLVSAFFGLFITFFILLLSDKFNNKFKSTEDIQSVLDLPVIGIIPFENGAAVKAKKPRKVSK